MVDALACGFIFSVTMIQTVDEIALESVTILEF